MSLQMFGESLVLQYLLLQGVRILGRNIYCKPYGEIDILCVWKQYIICIEVRTRKSDSDQFFPMISAYKKAKLYRSLSFYKAKNREYGHLTTLCLGYGVFISVTQHSCRIQRLLL
jgi:Holliday junction resolvase-like predicted endonuclease